MPPSLRSFTASKMSTSPEMPARSAEGQFAGEPLHFHTREDGALVALAAAPLDLGEVRDGDGDVGVAGDDG